MRGNKKPLYYYFNTIVNQQHNDMPSFLLKALVIKGPSSIVLSHGRSQEPILVSGQP